MSKELTQLGLIGYPLSHSFSPKYFNDKFKREGLTGYHYDLYPITSSYHFKLLTSFHPQIQGLNVTLPFKESIMAHLDKIDELAEAVGAVNTIVFKEGKTIGYNTDVPGFKLALETFLKETAQKPTGALILGSGGASKAVRYALSGLDMTHKIVSRNPEAEQIGYTAIDEKLLSEFPLIINTTPLGTYPKMEEAPMIPYDLLSGNNLLFDLIYNPDKTLFLAQGEAQGCQVQNGQKMLEAQAEFSWSLWNS